MSITSRLLTSDGQFLSNNESKTRSLMPQPGHRCSLREIVIAGCQVPNKNLRCAMTIPQRSITEIRCPSRQNPPAWTIKSMKSREPKNALASYTLPVLNALIN